MSLKEYRFDITTSALGAYDTTHTQSATGTLYAVKLVIGTIDAGNTTTLSYTRASDGVAVTLLTLTNPASNAIYYPRHQVHSNAGAGLTLDGTQIAHEQPTVSGALRVVVAAGGNAATGILHVYVEEQPC